MDTFRTFTQEHHALVARIVALEAALDSLEASNQPISSALSEKLQYAIKRLRDHCMRHMHSEESQLFAIASHDRKIGACALAEMLREHEKLSDLSMKFSIALEEMAQDEPGFDNLALKAGRDLALELRNHIERENDLFFPTLSNLVPRSEKASTEPGIVIA